MKPADLLYSSARSCTPWEHGKNDEGIWPTGPGILGPRGPGKFKFCTRFWERGERECSVSGMEVVSQ